MNVCVTGNTTGLCRLNKIITVCYDRRLTDIFCGKPAELLHVKSCDCASNGYSTLFPANDAVHCSILSSLYVP
jgi:hypothetical protein